MRKAMIGPYRLAEPLGEGGMGQVFKGRDVLLERDVAIKLIRPEYAHQPDFQARFRIEAKALARLSHPNIVALYAFIQRPRYSVMVMEFIPGETLRARLAREATIPWPQALRLFCQALAGVEHAHVSYLEKEAYPTTAIKLNWDLTSLAKA